MSISMPSTTRRAPSRARRVVAATAAMGLAAAGLVAFNLPVSANDQDTLPIYGDELTDGFENYSWGDVDLASTSPTASGALAISARLDAWEGLYLAVPTGMTIPFDGELRFSVNGGDNAGGAPLVVQLVGSGGGQGPAVEITAPEGRWEQMSIALSDLGSFGTIEGLWWQEARGGSLAPIHVDDVAIVGGGGDGGAAPPPPPPPGADATLTVKLGSHTITRPVTDPYTEQTVEQAVTFPHPIDDDVYGMNFAPDSLREELGLTVNRWGGNAVERYNHKTGSTNLGNDWYFANSDGEAGDDHRFENDNQADGTKTILTIPLSGWVSKDVSATCSYPTTDRLGAANNAGQQDATIDHWLDGSVTCGNGYRNGEFLGGVDPTLTSMAVDEQWAAEWVREMVSTHGSAAEGGVELYAMGNEPGLWSSTHGDVRPDPITRQEIIDRNLSYGRAVKGADPTAEVIGPVLWSGYSYYVTRPELDAGQYPGVLPTFVADYLDAMAAAEAQGGTRVLDRLAVNFYDDRVYGGGSDALRLEAPRTLWDPTYAPGDWWVTRDFLKGDGTAVIPRLQSLIDAHYPGTKLAITEYNFGAPDSLAGGLAQAEALGIMGREGLDMATVWEPFADWTGLTEEEFGARPLIHAFRLYRNYDGAGGRFGDRSLYAESADPDDVSIYAAERTSDGALTVMIINSSTQAKAHSLALDGRTGTAEVYRYSGQDLSGIVRLDDEAIATQTVLQLPARSATLLVLPAGGGDPGPAPAPTPITEEPAPAPEPPVTPPSTDDPVDPSEPSDPSPAPTPPATPAEPRVSAGAMMINAPSSMAEGGPLDSNETTWVWPESGPVALSDDLAVNRITPGSFNGRDDERATIPAGSTVCSYRVWADRLDDGGQLRGSITFDGAAVLGLVYRNRQVKDSEFLRDPSTASKIGPLESRDQVALAVDDRGSTVAWDLNLGRGLDGLRILTDCGSG